MRVYTELFTGSQQPWDL